MTAPLDPEIGSKPRTLNWRKKPSRLPRPYIDRQGLITHVAFVLLGGRDSAISFLNSYRAGLGARPLDLAGDSVAGYSAVCGEIERLACVLLGERR